MRRHRVCAALLLAHGAAEFSPASLAGATGGGARAGVSLRPPRTTAQPAAPLALRCEMTKLEASAVQRMTKGYDKLCKNCPTRLVPRADTLAEVRWLAPILRVGGSNFVAPGRWPACVPRAAAERTRRCGAAQMIMGLPVDEREALLQTVAQRTEAAAGGAGPEQGQQGVATPRELYDFQLAGGTGGGAGLTPPMAESGPRPIGVEPPSAKAKMKMEKEKMKMPEGGDKMQMKLMEKMEKCRRKIGESEMKMARVARLLAVADILIAQGADAPVECADAGDAEDIAELRMMKLETLELKRLKYLEKQAKCARKVAERQLELREMTQEYDALAQGSLAC